MSFHNGGRTPVASVAPRTHRRPARGDAPNAPERAMPRTCAPGAVSASAVLLILQSLSILSSTISSSTNSGGLTLRAGMAHLDDDTEPVTAAWRTIAAGEVFAPSPFPSAVQTAVEAAEHLSIVMISDTHSKHGSFAG